MVIAGARYVFSFFNQWGPRAMAGWKLPMLYGCLLQQLLHPADLVRAPPAHHRGRGWGRLRWRAAELSCAPPVPYDGGCTERGQGVRPGRDIECGERRGMRLITDRL